MTRKQVSTVLVDCLMRVTPIRNYGSGCDRRSPLVRRQSDAIRQRESFLAIVKKRTKKLLELIFVWAFCFGWCWWGTYLHRLYSREGHDAFVVAPSSAIKCLNNNLERE